MSWHLAGRPLRRILVTRLRYLGDVVLSTIVADVLKRGDPSVEIGFLCEADHAPVLAGHSSLDRIHVLETGRRGSDAAARRGDGPSAEEESRGRGTLGTIRRLRRARYDLAVDLFFNPRSAWILRLAGTPLRIGGTAGSRRRLYTHVQPRAAAADPREVLRRRAPGTLGDHLCRLAPLRHGSAGTPFLDWLEDSDPADVLQPRIDPPPLGEQARRALAAAGFAPDGDWLVAAPGATWPAKAWPMGHWRELLVELGESMGGPVAVLVPPGADGDWATLPGALGPLPLAAALEVVGRARALVSVDGGVMHAAVAMGVPTVALFGPTDPAIWFPYPDRPSCRVLATRPVCHPCDRHHCPPEEFVCLPGLQPPEVAAALDEVLVAGGDGA